MIKTVFDPTGTILTDTVMNGLQEHNHKGENLDGSCPQLQITDLSPALLAALRSGTSVVGDLKVIAGTIPDYGWLICNGVTVPADAMYDPLRTYIDAKALYLKVAGAYLTPDLLGRTVIGAGRVTGDLVVTPFAIGVKGGEINHTLIPDEMPAHSHVVNMGLCGHQRQTGGDLSYTVQGDNNNAARTDVPTTPMVNSTSIHNNMQPYLPLTWVIKAIN